MPPGKQERDMAGWLVLPLDVWDQAEKKEKDVNGQGNTNNKG